MSADEKLEEAAAFGKEVKATFPIIHDAKSVVFDKFGVQGYPTNIVIGKDGKVLSIIEGADTKKIDAAVTQALARK